MNTSSHSQALDRPRKTAENIGLQASAPPDHDEASLDLGAVWETFKRSKWMILLSCVLVTGAMGAYTWSLPKIYEARAIVAVEAPTATSPVMRFGGAPELDSEIGILENSGELSRRVLATLRAIADTTQSAQFPLLRPDDTGRPADDFTIIERLQENMAFAGSATQGLITISARSESPEEAAVVANVFAEEYRLFSQEIAREGVVAARRFLEGQLEKRKDDIQQIEGEWELFARSNAVATEGQDGQQVAREYVERVESMSGGRIQIDLLPAGAIVKAFQVMDAVSDGLIDIGHDVPVYWYGKNKAASLFGTGPVFGGSATTMLSWFYEGGGKKYTPFGYDRNHTTED